MAKRRQREPYAKRPYAVEYYKGLSHKNPVKRGFCMTEENAYVKAGEHLDRGHYPKAVIVKRATGLVVVSRLKFANRTTWDQKGDLAPGSFDLKVHIPSLEEN